MTREQPNGCKTDVWSLGVSIGYLLGLNNIFPANYPGGIPGFVKDCVGYKHNLLLTQEGIFLSPVLTDLLQKMLTVNQKLRIDISGVLQHKFITEPTDKYNKMYKDWTDKEIPRRQGLIKQQEEALKNVPADHLEPFKKMFDHEKELYLGLSEKQAQAFVKMGKPQRGICMELKEENRIRFLAMKASERGHCKELNDEYLQVRYVEMT